jgi:hypothetical protein
MMGPAQDLWGIDQLNLVGSDVSVVTHIGYSAQIHTRR